MQSDGVGGFAVGGWVGVVHGRHAHLIESGGHHPFALLVCVVLWCGSSRFYVALVFMVPPPPSSSPSLLFLLPYNKEGGDSTPILPPTTLLLLKHQTG